MPYLDCDIKNLPLDVLFKGLITVDANGEAALRVVNSVDSGNDLLNCDLKNMTIEQALRQVIVLDSNGKPAINLAAAPAVP